MHDDIVEDHAVKFGELLAWAEKHEFGMAPFLRWAADEIERLTAENQRLHAQIERVGHLARRDRDRITEMHDEIHDLKCCPSCGVHQADPGGHFSECALARLTEAISNARAALTGNGISITSSKRMIDEALTYLEATDG